MSIQEHAKVGPDSVVEGRPAPDIGGGGTSRRIFGGFNFPWLAALLRPLVLSAWM